MSTISACACASCEVELALDPAIEWCARAWLSPCVWVCVYAWVLCEYVCVRVHDYFIFLFLCFHALLSRRCPPLTSQTHTHTHKHTPAHGAPSSFQFRWCSCVHACACACACACVCVFVRVSMGEVRLDVPSVSACSGAVPVHVCETRTAMKRATPMPSRMGARQNGKVEKEAQRTCASAHTLLCVLPDDRAHTCSIHVVVS